MRARRWIENFLLLAGLVGVNVFIWSRAGPVIYQAWEERIFERQVREQQQNSEQQHAAVEQNPVDPEVKRRNDRLLGRLVIPRLRLRAMVREGVGDDTLTLALGHIPYTALPGQQGNVGIAGHRDTLLRPLRGIRKNDLIVFETVGKKYAYRVQSTKIVKPHQVSVLEAGRFSELTLVTCYPFRYIGAAPDRFVVKARLVKN